MNEHKVYIVVKTNFVGYHEYPGAPDEVSFLRALHRHTFYVEVKIKVNHDDRDLEFFMVRNELDKCVEHITEFLSAKDSSCERMARKLLNAMQHIYPKHFIHSVSVYEDNENGAVVEQIEFVWVQDDETQ